MLDLARAEGIPTVWDRAMAQEPQCGYCALGVSCRNCSMGPCRIDPFGEGPQVGVCGADGGPDRRPQPRPRRSPPAPPSHSDHGRDILEVFEADGARARRPATASPTRPSCRRLAEEWSVETGERPVDEIARDLAAAMYEDFGSRKTELGFVARAPDQRRALWKRLALTPRGIDRENVEMLHRTHMGVDNDYANLLLHALRTEPGRRLGRLDDRDRAVRRPVRHAAARSCPRSTWAPSRTTTSTSSSTATTRSSPR